MTTNESSSIASPTNQRESYLIQTILKGEPENAALVASEMSKQNKESNEVIDVISEAMNIATDLHDVEKYSSEQLEKCEKAAESALDALKGRIRIEQKKIHGRVMVASLAADPHSFQRTLMLTMLKACGFTPIDGGAELTPAQFAEAVKSHKPDALAVPILTREAAEQLLSAIPIIRSSHKKTGIVVFGRGAQTLSLPAEYCTVEQDSMSAVSRVTELLISKD
ncbi:MAG TPA: hypothetical protein VE177_01895 [Candidatus Binatus sp.]|nr:hypothetical protein [Candidatus Binatus sp.]